ncbi:MAG: HAMP domain-containing sensor histidine kinase [Elusimicrobia bacterium]|nr:HAMP domain-containing sensor histidine kinase [Elusimicrobiota bacterium]
MKIRTKLSLTTAALIGAVVLAVALSVSAAQREALAAQRLQGLTEGVERLSRESLDNQDPLMVLSYLLYMQKEHPELAYAAVTSSGHTTTLGAKRPGLLVWTGKAGPRREVGAELGFDRRLLADEVARALGPLSRRTALIAGLFMVLGWAAAFLLARRFTGPLTALVVAADAVRKGNLDAAVPPAGGDEVGALIRSFNAMTAHLKEDIQFREDLLHTLTHELNTPLGGLKGYLELWQDGKLAPTGPERAEMLQTMSAAVLRMGHSLENAIGMFRHGRAYTAKHKHVVWIDDVLRETCRIFSPVVRARKIELELPLFGITKYLHADEESLRQIVVNLVSNALKYTPDGGRVRVGLEADDDVVRFWVSDTGCGIKAEDLPHLFTKFYRGETESGRERIPGSGLGLNIAQKAALSLGGTITVTSEPGRGSVFTVTVPKRASMAGAS